MPSKMKVHLTRKYATRIDGIDLSGHEIGDVLDLPAEQAHLLIAEDWAHPDRRFQSTPTEQRRRADDGRRRTVRLLRAR
jgi:hypothetical protein